MTTALNHVFEFLAAVMSDEEARTRLAQVLEHARDDFLNADLTEANLAGAWLEGVMWKPAATRWPPDWRERIEHDSVEIFPDVWQIHGGNLREEVPV